MEEAKVTALTTYDYGTKGYRKTPGLSVKEVYLDGKLLRAEEVNEEEKSFGIFMHSLVLSNYAELMRVDNTHIHVIGEDTEKAIHYYASSKGFDKRLMESIAPRVADLSAANEGSLKISARRINDKTRIISKGTPEHILSRCTYVLLDSKLVKMTRRLYITVNDAMRDMLSRCLNVYAIAIKDENGPEQEGSAGILIRDMALVGLVGIR